MLKADSEAEPKARGAKLPLLVTSERGPGRGAGTNATSLKSHLDNPSPLGYGTRGSFDVLANVSARKGLEPLPVAKQDVNGMLYSLIGTKGQAGEKGAGRAVPASQSRSRVQSRECQDEELGPPGPAQ